MLHETSDEALPGGFQADWTLIRKRAAVLKLIRRYFDSRDFLEIEPPILTPFPTLDANIDSVRCTYRSIHSSGIALFLHTSPEYAMKKLLAAGSGCIFSLGKVFRDEAFGEIHHPEFTLLEWYHTGMNYLEILGETEDLILFVARSLSMESPWTYQGRMIDSSPPWPRIRLNDLMIEHAGLDLTQEKDLAFLRSFAKVRGIYHLESDTWDTLFFRIFLEKVEPHLHESSRPFFVIDYPEELGLLAKEKNDLPGWVERAELYIAGMEISNGYTECDDPVTIKRRWTEEQRKKRGTGQSDLPMDEALLDASGRMPSVSGMALGVDRLIMLLTNAAHIRDVLVFPFHDEPLFR